MLIESGKIHHEYVQTLKNEMDQLHIKTNHQVRKNTCKIFK